jgi:prepilin-type processing-associated H-X9-DG protein
MLVLLALVLGLALIVASVVHEVLNLRSDQVYRRWRNWLSLGMALAGVAIIAAIVLAVIRAHHEVHCAANLRAWLHLELHAYARDHDGRLPNTLSELLDNARGEYWSVLICPSEHGRVPKASRDLADWVLQHSSYEYVGSGLLWEELMPATVLAYEREPRHGGQRSVLFGDGHVQLRDADDWSWLVARSPATQAVTP